MNEFKDTEIGRIPKEWEVVRLGDKKIAELVMGQSPPSSTYNKNKKGLPFLQGKIEFGEIYPTPETYCSQPIKIAEPNDILLSVRAPVGDVNLAPFKCCIGRGLSAIRTRPDKVHHLFLFYYLKQNGKRFEILSSGSTFKAIRRQEVEKFLLPLPPLPEQRRIAEILSTVDEAIQKVDEVIAKTERLKRGLMQELLTRGVNLFLSEKEKIINSVRKAFENGDHKFGREENLAQHLADYLREQFSEFDVDAEVERTGRLRPDIIVHERNTNVNLFALEVKKEENVESIRQDIEKLENLMLKDYKCCEGVFVGFNIRNPEKVLNLSEKINFVLVTPDGEIKIKVRKREFKDTEIGRIPKEWEVVILGGIIDEIKNGFASGKRDENGIVQIRMNNVTTDGRLVFDSYVKVPIPENVNEWLLKEGDFLFNNTNSYDLVGKSTIFTGAPFPCTFSNHFTRIRFKKEILPELILYNFILLWEKGYFKSVAIRHVGQSAVHIDYLLKLQLPLPPLPEQRRIAEILSTVDKKLELERERKETLVRIKKGLMNVLFTGKKRVKT